MIKDKTLNDLYNELKFILSGCNSVDDGLYFLSKICDNKEHHKILSNYVKTYNYPLALDFKTMIETIEMMDGLQYSDDVYDEINKLTNKTTCNLQLATFIKIADSKPLRPEIGRIKHIFDVGKEGKCKRKCPHCFKEYIMSIDTNYLICGYTDTTKGYDWSGCGRDWCFQCGKKLCKVWNVHNLFQSSNRIHDDICCLEHSKKNGLQYPNVYCSCKNQHVQRNKYFS